MARSGEQRPTNRSWQCKRKSYQKEVTGQQVLYMLYYPPDTAWKDEATEEADQLEP